MPLVEHLRPAVYVVPLEEPESDGTFTWDATTVVTVEATADGVTGLGFTYATGACAPLIRDVLLPTVVGMDAFDVPGAWSAMIRAIRNIGRGGVASMSIAAVDVALWDLKARLLDLPLSTLLGRCRDTVPVYGSGGFTSFSEKELLDQLTGWVEQGIPRVKMKIGTGWGTQEDRDVQRIRAVRRAIGEGAELFVDANGAYQRKQAVRVWRRVEGVGVDWFEEPVSSDDLEGLAAVRGLVDADVAAGEYGYTLAYFSQLVGAVDVLQADVSRCAGITEWLRAAAVAAGHGLQISGHCAQQLHLHPACAVPNLRHLEYFADHARVDGILFDGVVVPRGGELASDLSRSGHGLELRRDASERYRRET